MKLPELEPRWYALESEGPRVGLTFDCPHCRTQRLGVLFHERGREAIEDEYIKTHHGNAADSYIWTLDGQEDFATLTLSPSVDASKYGHWHGWIKNGEVT